jgi:ubiquinone/menaquinone biosynthesis C-methylase UbiE
MSKQSLHNVDDRVAAGFGDEWGTFRQDAGKFRDEDRDAIFDDYFHIFPWDRLPPDCVGLDAGCGSGRWSVKVAPRVGHLHLLDASKEALAVARDNLRDAGNVTFHHASAGQIPLPPNSLDFAFSLGVLHHIPDTESAIVEIGRKLKPGAPFLIYLYYAMENRPAWYRALWRTSNVLRVVVSRLPHPLRLAASQTIAALVYWPMARLALLAEKLGANVQMFPLEMYRDKAFYVMRTDAYDRFCTQLEKRFTRTQIADMLGRAGFGEITFSERVPYWCAVGIRR